jgi:hypothetical protein
MTLEQFHTLKLWHQSHSRERPLERHAWDAVLLLWITGWAGGPVALLVGAFGWAVLCIRFLFLPGAYVQLRKRLHRERLLRCDWIGAVR